MDGRDEGRGTRRTEKKILKRRTDNNTDRYSRLSNNKNVSTACKKLLL